MLTSPVMQRPDLHRADLERLDTLEAPEAVTRLAAIVGALPTCDDPGALEELARALPGAVAGLAPEVCLALQGLAMALVPHGPVIPRDIAGLEPSLRVAWRRVQLAVGDLGALTSLGGEEWLQVVHGWTIDGVLDPAPLLRHLMAADDVRLRAIGLAWIEPAVRQLAVAPAEAFTLLLPLATDADATLRSRAIARLCDGWVRGLPPAAARERERIVLAALVDAEPTVAAAAVTAAAVMGRRDWLLELVLAEEGLEKARVHALDVLGPLARDEDIDLAFALAASSPLRFGPPLRRFLLAAHRHGIFVRERHLDELLAAFDDHPPWTGEELVRVTYIVRAELVERLAACAADDPRWIRRRCSGT